MKFGNVPCSCRHRYHYRIIKIETKWTTLKCLHLISWVVIDIDTIHNNIVKSDIIGMQFILSRSCQGMLLAILFIIVFSPETLL
jgi:hypothetical protein